MIKDKNTAPFIGEDFLLETPSARHLFHEYATKMPIIDYHCHLDPQLIAENYKFSDITELWLKGDHYKWRIMRANGVEERFITGNSTNREKFHHWVVALSKAYGNPLYHWAHLELQRYFDYHGVLSPETEEEVWNLCNKKIATSGLTARQLIVNSGVEVLVTTDDPADSLEHHIALKNDPIWRVGVHPGWRPDKAFAIETSDFIPYIKKLGGTANVEIIDLDSLKKALLQRMDFFHQQGCRISDHGLDKAYFSPSSHDRVGATLKKSLKGQPLTQEENEAYKTYLLLFMAEEYAKRGWVMQLHFAAQRNLNSKMFKQLGADTGFDSIGESISSRKLIAFLDELEQKDALPKAILYSLNPNDEPVLASILNAFQSAGVKSKLQLGVPWWFNDTKSNMERGLITLANATLLGNFIGMLTDSRSFTSYPRHEYFRRILCGLLGRWVESGEIPNDMLAVGSLVEDICYNNAKNYFNF